MVVWFFLVLIHIEMMQAVCRQARKDECGCDVIPRSSAAGPRLRLQTAATKTTHQLFFWYVKCNYEVKYEAGILIC